MDMRALPPLTPWIGLLGGLLLLTASTCRKDLDFLPGHCYTTGSFLRAGNTRVYCGRQAAVEGDTLCLTGILEPMSGTPAPGPVRFTLIDGDESMQVVGTTADSAALAIRIQSGRYRDVRVTGVIVGFDRPTQWSCRRGYELHIGSPEAIEWD